MSRQIHIKETHAKTRHTEVFTSVKKSPRKHSPKPTLVFSVPAVPVGTAWPGK